MFSTRESASRGAFACTVVIEPSWPVFIACSMSNASAPRTSPTMMRSGRIRSALMTRSRWLTPPLPLAPAGRASSGTTCSWRSCSSFGSSMVTIRSEPGTYALSAFSSVVFPEPVPPEITTFSFDTTHARRNAAAAAESVPVCTRSAMSKRFVLARIHRRSGLRGL